jgi:hypothetical protein
MSIRPGMVTPQGWPRRYRASSPPGFFLARGGGRRLIEGQRDRMYFDACDNPAELRKAINELLQGTTFIRGTISGPGTQAITLIGPTEDQILKQASLEARNVAAKFRKVCPTLPALPDPACLPLEAIGRMLAWCREADAKWTQPKQVPSGAGQVGGTGPAPDGHRPADATEELDMTAASNRPVERVVDDRTAIEASERIAAALEDWAHPKDEGGLRHEYVGHERPIRIALTGFDEILRWLRATRPDAAGYIQALYDSLIEKARLDDHLLDTLYDTDVVHSVDAAEDLAAGVRMIWAASEVPVFEEGAGVAGETPDTGRRPYTFGPGYRSVDWYGVPYSFTDTQAAMVEILAEAYKAGTPDVDAELLVGQDAFTQERIKAKKGKPSAAKRVRDVFRNHPAWGTMITPGGTRGTYQLSKP